MSEPDRGLPDRARVVIVGGGIAGCSVAYHLAKLGWNDIVLLEQGRLAGGTSWHAAGMVGRLRTSSSMTKINQYSVDLYSTLEQETGVSTGWKQVGSLIVARCEERMVQLRRSVAMAEYLGAEAHMIDAQTALEKCPIMRSDDLLGAAWLPGDGKVQPEQTTLSLAQGARQMGVNIVEGIRVSSLLQERGRVSGVVTDQGPVESEYVVLCGGMWTRQIGLEAGVTLPLYPVEHHYAVSNPLPGAWDEMPCCRDPDGTIYWRGEGNQVLLGAFQAYTKPWNVDPIPADFSFQLLEDDWEKFEEPVAEGYHRLPGLQEIGFERFVNGPESFTPDNQFLLGETPELNHLYVAAGFNSAGIACSGGAGKVLADWMSAGEPPFDLWTVDVRRFAAPQNDREFLKDRVGEVLGLHYQLAWPNREFATGRNRRLSPLHDRLAARGACFGNKMGLERPNWFARGDGQAQVEYSFGRQNWFADHRTEHLAARQQVAIFDQTSFSKYYLQGRDALSLLQRLCGNEIDVPTGKVVYTGMFNERGTFESDLTVIRQTEDLFYVISPSAQRVRDAHWITRHRESGEQVTLQDMTEQFSVLGLMGPGSRELLSRVVGEDLADFPFGTARKLQIGEVEVLAARVTYVGELGWELHVSVAGAVQVYDAIQQAGRDLGLEDAGHYAINSLRLEKGYRAWGADISPDDTPLEAGLSFAVAWDKPVPFIGRDALLRQRDSGVFKRMTSFVLKDPEPVLWHDEPIYRDGECVGYLSSAAYGHSLGAAVALGYVRSKEPITREFVLTGQYEIDVAGERCPAKPYLMAPYDAKREKILA
ncbi:MAG: FAD-dependent oxidoreductase [Mariniblastus sp.]|nr:FAD-dependent oxidoreductase [Mariniblastus sp.]